MTKSRERTRERDFARVQPTSVESVGPPSLCARNRPLRAGLRVFLVCMHPHPRKERRPKPFLVDVWVEDTHGRRKQRIMVITVIKRRPLRTRPGPSVENSSFLPVDEETASCFFFNLRRFNFLHPFCNASYNFTPLVWTIWLVAGLTWFWDAVCFPSQFELILREGSTSSFFRDSRRIVNNFEEVLTVRLIDETDR